MKYPLEFLINLVLSYFLFVCDCNALFKEENTFQVDWTGTHKTQTS